MALHPSFEGMKVTLCDFSQWWWTVSDKYGFDIDRVYGPFKTQAEAQEALDAFVKNHMDLR